MTRCNICRRSYTVRVCPQCKCYTPSRETIRARCAAIRKGWSAKRLAHDELYEELDITKVHRGGDHMRRKGGEVD